MYIMNTKNFKLIGNSGCRVIAVTDLENMVSRKTRFKVERRDAGRRRGAYAEPCTVSSFLRIFPWNFHQVFVRPRASRKNKKSKNHPLLYCSPQDFHGSIRRENPWNVTSNSLNTSFFGNYQLFSRPLFSNLDFNVPQEFFNNIFETELCSFFSTSHFRNKNVAFQRLSNLRSIEYSFFQLSFVPLYFEVNVWDLFIIMLIWLENWVRCL